jgi:hypothetical protein
MTRVRDDAQARRAMLEGSTEFCPEPFDIVPSMTSFVSMTASKSSTHVFLPIARVGPRTIAGAFSTSIV